MSRLLVLTLLLFASAPIYALGLGEIHSEMGINQYLDAEIEVLSVTKDEVPQLNVKLADKERFERAGVTWYASLNELRFEVVTKEDGKVVIKVTSMMPIREPVLDFLVEARTANDSVVREYVILLDKPGS